MGGPEPPDGGRNADLQQLKMGILGENDRSPEAQARLSPHSDVLERCTPEGSGKKDDAACRSFTDSYSQLAINYERLRQDDAPEARRDEDNRPFASGLVVCR